MRDLAISVGATVIPIALTFVVIRAVSALLGDRHFGGKGQYRLLRQALKSDSIPEGADQAAWRVALRRLKQRRERQKWPSYVPAVVVLVLLVSMNIAGVLGEDSSTSGHKAALIAITLTILTIYLGGLLLVIRRAWGRQANLLQRLEATG